MAKTNEKTEEKALEDKKIVEKKEEKKSEKERAIVNGFSLIISPKQSYSICRMIKGKSIDKAIEYLEKVVLMKKAVPMNNREVPHRKGNLMAGRYPITAAIEFIKLLKQLKANVSVNNIENNIITIAMANRASRPYKRGGRRGKRTNVYIEAKDRKKIGEKK
jgi:large subunit ribosomal protein L22